VKRYIVATTLEVDADTAEGAAFLMYEHLTNKPAPLDYRVEDQEGALDVSLEQSTADLFARLDHTADPGNW
jgi:hypothetical protein